MKNIRTLDQYYLHVCKKNANLLVGNKKKHHHHAKESNNLRFSDLEDIQFSAPKGLFSKPRPYTYQVGSRHSPDTKNTKIYVLGAENCKIHQALKYLRQLISE